MEELIEDMMEGISLLIANRTVMRRSFQPRIAVSSFKQNNVKTGAMK